MSARAFRCAYSVLFPFSSSALSVGSGVMLVLHLNPSACRPALTSAALAVSVRDSK